MGELFVLETCKIAIGNALLIQICISNENIKTFSDVGWKSYP
jgi:hypothetical protein